jgi:hypothetical protein
MILPESPKALAFDGSLVTVALWVAHNATSAILWLLTAVILLLRAMILYRQWKRG